MGKGDRALADRMAVEAMRSTFDHLPVSGTVVIGEGERDEAPMLYIGEKVGAGGEAIDIAVDPLEGTNLVATGDGEAIAVLATSEPGGLIHAPDIYMEKLMVGPSSAGEIDLDAPVAENLEAIARCLSRSVEDLLIVVLDRKRHQQLISEIRATGARIKLIPDGDLTAAISAAVRGTGVHAVMGTGGAPEGVLAAAALRCLGGEVQSRFVPRTPADIDRLKEMGIADHRKVFRTEDLAPGQELEFVATGVTDGSLLKGVRFFGGGCRTHSVTMSMKDKVIRFMESIHLQDEIHEHPSRAVPIHF
jgi:fructose-1,6-bisphosphatase II